MSDETRRKANAAEQPATNARDETLDALERRRLATLADTCFDILWEGRVEGPGVNGEVEYLRDPSSDLGLPPGQFPRRIAMQDILALFHPDDLEEQEQLRARAIERREGFDTEFRVRAADGSYTWWEETVVPPLAEDPEQVWLGAARNITARRAAEEERERALAELREIKDRLERENVYLREEFDRLDQFHDLVGESPPFQRVLEQIDQVAPTPATVLVTGETGTGKELVARAIHRLSPRRDRPLIALNCAALPATLIESELFGHERGAYTGAVTQRIGRFEAAHQGTLFLDEVGELPLELQTKLLRVLESGELQRLGSNETRQVDVRVVAATNRDLEKAAVDGDFRPDLLYRLRVFPIEIPPLRERREDIPLLATYLTEKRSHALGRKIERVPRAALERLMAYDWPGNVRELENVLERAIILSKGSALELAEPLSSRSTTPAASPVPLPREAPAQTLEEIERQHIVKVCTACDWRIKGEGGAAERLGLNSSTLYFRLKKLGIELPGKRGRRSAEPEPGD